MAITERRKHEIADQARRLLESGRVKPGYEGLTEEEALCVILVKVGFDEVRARFVLAQERGELPDRDGEDVVVYGN